MPGRPAMDVVTMKGRPAMDVVTMKGRQVMDVVTMKGRPAMDVVTMKGRTAMDLVTMKGRPAMDVVTLKGRTAMDVVTMKDRPAMDVVTMKGRPAMDVVTMKGRPAMDVVTMPGRLAMDVVTLKGRLVMDVFTMKGNPAMDVVTMPGRPVMVLVTMKGRPAMDVVTMKGRPAMDVVTMPGRPAMDVYYNAGPACYGRSYNAGPACYGRSYNEGQACDGRSYNAGPACYGRSYNAGSACDGRSYNEGQACDGRSYNAGPACYGRSYNAGSACDGCSYNEGEACYGRIYNEGQACDGRSYNEGQACYGRSYNEWPDCDGPISTLAGFNPRPGHRFFASGNSAGRCCWSAGFLEDLPFPPPLHSGAASYSLQSPASALKTSLLRDAQISSLTIDPGDKYNVDGSVVWLVDTRRVCGALSSAEDSYNVTRRDKRSWWVPRVLIREVPRPRRLRRWLIQWRDGADGPPVSARCEGGKGRGKIKLLLRLESLVSWLLRLPDLVRATVAQVPLPVPSSADSSQASCKHSVTEDKCRGTESRLLQPTAKFATFLPNARILAAPRWESNPSSPGCTPSRSCAVRGGSNTSSTSPPSTSEALGRTSGMDQRSSQSPAYIVTRLLTGGFLYPTLQTCANSQDQYTHYQDFQEKQGRNARTGETVDPRENPSTSGIVRHDSQLRNSGSDPAWGLNPVRLANEFVLDLSMSANEFVLDLSRRGSVLPVVCNILDAATVGAVCF
ncbi:hypothetical protein PR048_024234 [Dryococelus australis]|uniref:Uncharacterized protein n=1 Tax=Dryococelus australis TaxID=614101 RepID=A0ABQ9GN31_9NEOP|nr:hypothetical protein PR048_024234 [Dryococelus australis]